MSNPSWESLVGLVNKKCNCCEKVDCEKLHLIEKCKLKFKEQHIKGKTQELLKLQVLKLY